MLTFRAGCFSKSTVTAFSSFSDFKRLRFQATSTIQVGGFQRGVFVRSQQLGWLRAPVAIINFAFFVRELLVESYIYIYILDSEGGGGVILRRSF